MGRRRILIIEDDDAIRQGVADALRLAHYETVEAAAGRRGLQLALTSEWDVLLLDLILPELDGFEILKEVRAARPTAPIIILTARGEEEDRVRGLRLGADDYVVKPFGVRELLARVEAVLRRSPERPSDIRRVLLPDGVADLERGEVQLSDGRRYDLSEREAELLAYLARQRGRAISRDELLSRVWRVDPSGIETRTIDMHIARLREKLGDDATHPRVIMTVRGKGYRLAVEEDRG
jgi:DNA-binding response OmpR family regulator